MVWMLLLVIAFSVHGQFSGKPFHELSLLSQSLIIGGPPLVLFLLLRRWRRPKLLMSSANLR